MTKGETGRLPFFVTEHEKGGSMGYFVLIAILGAGWLVLSHD